MQKKKKQYAIIKRVYLYIYIAVLSTLSKKLKN